MTVGVTKSPLCGAACCTSWLRNSSPTSGSETTVGATTVAHQSSVADRGSAAPAPAVDGGRLLGDLADALPGRVGVPGRHVRGAVEALDLLGQREVVEREVL